jgi:hypothetical protein
MRIKKKRISDFTSIIGNVAQTSHYQVFFDGLSGDLLAHLSSKGVNRRFIGENAGLLCHTAMLPGSNLSTASITGNFTGVTEKFVHTRMFDQMSLQFYVDKEYKMIKFMEHWMEYITNGSGENKSDVGYHYRMKYPREPRSGYKADKTKIVKFDRDYKNQIEYTFFGMFPIGLNSTPIQYGNSDALKMDVTFNYERYIAGRETSISRRRGANENNIPSKPPQVPDLVPVEFPQEFIA